MCPAGKSSLAQQLASRLNLPNVLQTDVLYEVRWERQRGRAVRDGDGMAVEGFGVDELEVDGMP